MFRKICQNDFYEEVNLSTRGILGDKEEMSKDDKMFLAIVEKETKKFDDHYEIPLPYRDGNLQLPKNKEQAIRKMQQLKKRFQNDPEFFNSYTKKIEWLILKGYAKRLSSNSNKRKTWYLPHHGIKHASKPGKVRIVFDYSVNSGGTSLTSLRPLQGVFKTSSRRFEDVLKMSSRHLQDILQRYLQDVFKAYHQVNLFYLTCPREVFNTFLSTEEFA